MIRSRLSWKYFWAYVYRFRPKDMITKHLFKTFSTRNYCNDLRQKHKRLILFEIHILLILVRKELKLTYFFTAKIWFRWINKRNICALLPIQYYSCFNFERNLFLILDILFGRGMYVYLCVFNEAYVDINI